MSRFSEVVLLVEPQATAIRFRPVILQQPRLHTIVERCRLAPDKIHERVWFNIHEERALSGQRIFREAPQPLIRDEQECPEFDEMHVTNLPLYSPEFNARDRRVKRERGKPIKTHRVPPEIVHRVK